MIADAFQIFGVITWIVGTIFGFIASIGLFMQASDIDDPGSAWLGLGVGIAATFSFSLMLAALQ